MKCDPYTSQHRVPALERAERLTLRAESREEQAQLALLARLSKHENWWEAIAQELEALETRRAAVDVHRG